MYAETPEKREEEEDYNGEKSVCQSIETGDRLKLARYLSSLSKIRDPDTDILYRRRRTYDEM